MQRTSPAFRMHAAVAFAAFGLAANASPAIAGSAALEAVGVPSGFEELAGPREIVVDIYFGGQKLGEVPATVRPGSLEFRDPAGVARLVPNALDVGRLAGFLSGALPANSGLVCPDASSNACGVLEPNTAGIIFDEQHFRVDIFVNPRLLRAVAEANPYLPAPPAQPSLTSSLGLAVSGTTASSPIYNFQNRTVLALGNMRVRSDASFASGLGFVTDDLVAEIDRPDFRYSAGLFWAPGLDLTGQRRIVGVGLGTQFDTRSDRESLRGTPLVVFLNQPARVEIVRDGRLIGSGLYTAGNNVLDTSSLPDGAYPLLLRIRESSGAVREEHRFFIKNTQIAPVGKPLYFAYAGMLANTRRYRPISLSKSLYYQLGTARRLSHALAVDISAMGTQKKTIAEAGAWLITPFVRLRMAGLVSTAGDHAALLQLGSAGSGSLSFSFDLRRVWSHDGEPLIPAPDYIENFTSGPPVRAQLGNGSYTQGVASLGYQLGPAQLSLIASYRKDRATKSDYSIGPSVEWLLVNRQGLQLSLDADAQRNRSTTSTFIGMRLLHTAGGFSTFNSTGYRSIRSVENGGRSASRMVSNLTGQYYYENEDRTQISLDGGVERTTDLSSVHANGTLYSRFGSVRADLLHEFGGALQYGLNLQTGAAIDPKDLALGGRELQESAVVATLDGLAPGAKFEVLVDEQPHGQVSNGGRLPIFLQPYRHYKVRLRPVGGASVWYDSMTRDVTLYPGTVQHLSWHVDHVTSVFGQAVRPSGAPLANAMVQTKRGVGESDGQGYFQVDAGSGDSLLFTAADGASCHVHLGEIARRGAFASLGRIVCQ
jgi:hypothetical protein